VRVCTVFAYRAIQRGAVGPQLPANHALHGVDFTAAYVGENPSDGLFLATFSILIFDSLPCHCFVITLQFPSVVN